MNKDKFFICDDCKKSFSTRSNLVAHVKKFHPDKLEIIKPKKIYRYKCVTCGKNFNHIHNLKYHQSQAKHSARGPTITTNIGDIQTRKSYCCALCSHTTSKLELIDHIQSFHNIKIEKKLLQFNTVQEFELWKLNIEKNTKASYVKERGTYNSRDFIRTTFVCHRSGMYKRKGTGERLLKIQGSNKINAFCPARIKLTQKQEKCEVEFIETHLGHENDLNNLYLSKSEKQAIAARLAARIPMSVILDEVRNSATNNDLGRLHLLTRKDLYNIGQKHNLTSSAVRQKSNAISVQAWVNEVQDNEHILLYKPQGKMIDSYPNLHEEDFMLVIMNESQNQMLRKYGQDCICIDSTHGLNAYGFELHTLLVLNEITEGYPCCFCISNRSDVEAMRIFFSVVRQKLEFGIKPKVFMSDMTDSYYNAWIQVMGTASFKLYCTWHVDRDWRKNLNKINSKEKKDTLYKQLRTLMQETDQEAFVVMLEKFLESLQTDPELQEFYEYFLKNYKNSSECWAYCHRIQNGLSTNMYIEHMLRTIKYLYLNGKHTRRLDKAISALLKFVRDELFDEVIIINKGKLCSKINNIRSRHKRSISLSFDSILPHEEGWQIRSPTANGCYYIHEENRDCKCKLICTNCNICFHRYSCTCLDSTIKWNMCKHVHLLARYLMTPSLAEEDTIQNSDWSQDLQIDLKTEDQKLTSAISSSCHTKSNPENGSLISRKEKIKSEILDVLGCLESATSHAEVDVIEKALCLTKPTLAAIKQPVMKPALQTKEEVNES